MKKNNKLHIGITSEDKKRLEKKADELGLTLTGYCLMILLNSLKGKIEIQ